MTMHAARPTMSPAPPTDPNRLPDLATLVPWRAWLHHPALRTGPVAVVLALVVVPPLALLLSHGDEDASVVVFAAYFATAWWLLLRSVLRPQGLTPGMSVAVVATALLTQVPLATWLEGVLDAETENLFAGIVTVGVPEELAKMLPVVAVVLVLRHGGRALAPRDVMFLGVVSGLVFGATEAVHYVLDIYGDVLGRDDALGILWRLAAAPATHACWAGVAAFFVGLAAQRDPAHWAPLVGLGLGIAALLHGVSNWVVGGWAWVVVAGISAILLLAYSTVGAEHTEHPMATFDPAPPTAPICFRGPDGRLWG